MTTPRLPFAVVAAACLVLATACAPATPSPEESEAASAMTGTLTFSNGSLPPPGHYELELELTAETYTLTWSGYDDEVGSATGVPIDVPGAVAILDEAGLLAGDDDTGDCVGGSTADIDIEVDEERISSSAGTCGGEGGAGDVRDAIEAVTGADAVSDAVAQVKKATS